MRGRAILGVLVVAACGPTLLDVDDPYGTTEFETSAAGSTSTGPGTSTTTSTATTDPGTIGTDTGTTGEPAWSCEDPEPGPDPGQWHWTIEYQSEPGVWEAAFALTVADDGAVYVAGYQGYDEASDVVVQRRDLEGALVWSDVYDGGVNLADSATGATLDAAGNLYVVVREDSNKVIHGDSVEYDRAVVVLKYAPDGEHLWRFAAAEPELQAVRWVRATTAGSRIVLAGIDDAFAGGWPQAFVLELDTWGNELGRWWYLGDEMRGFETAGLAGTAAGDVFIGATVSPMGPGEDLVWIGRWNADRELVWSDAAELDHGHATAVSVDAEGSAILLGYDKHASWMRRYHPSGAERWTIWPYSEVPALLVARGVTIGCDGAVYATGHVWDEEITHAWISAYDADGVNTWTTHYMSGNDFDHQYPYAIAIDPGGHPLVAGQTLGPDDSYDLWLGKLAR